MNSRNIQYMSIALFALLLLWGTYTLLVYIGVPVHGAVLLNTASRDGIQPSTCDPGQTLCYLTRGLSSLLPAILHTFGRASTFLVYGVVSLLAWAAFAGWQWLKSGQSAVHVTWSPWKVLLVAIAALWLMFTTLSFGSVNGRPVRLYVEPTAETYNVSPQGLAVLKDDHQRLLDRGCLNPVGESSVGGARLYNLEVWCIQASFFTRAVPQVFAVLILLLELLIIGRALLRLLRVRPSMLAVEALLSAGLGACALIAVLWSFAVAGVYVSGVGWAILIAGPILFWKQTRYWFDRFLHYQWEGTHRWHDVTLLLGWLIISYLALNFLEVVRPFPIGWDDLGSYLNRPRLLVSYGRFIYSMSPFDWSYLTSLGFLLFGYASTFGSTASMMVNWSAGLLATLSVFVFARTFFGGRAGLLSALLYYSLPLVGHFSFADMKIDNAIFFFGALAMFCVFLSFFQKPESQGTAEQEETAPTEFPVPSPQSRLLLLAGLFGGFAFATKVTAIMILAALGATLLGLLFSWPAFIGSFFLAFLVFSWQGAFSIDTIAARITGAASLGSVGTIFTLVCVIGAAGCLGIAFWQSRATFTRGLRLLSMFVLGFVIAVLPWIEHNNLAVGRIIPRVELSAPNRSAPQVTVESLAGELAVDKKNPACMATGSIEELDRYWGFDKGWAHYLALPWRTIMNIDSVGYYVTTMPALLLLPLLLLLPYLWTPRGRWLRWLLGATAFMLLEWMFLSNGIPWYGIGIFLGTMIALEALATKAPDVPNRIVASVLIGVSILFSFGQRFWQFEQQRNIFEYTMGKISAAALEEVTIPHYNDISATVVHRHETMPDRPYLYRVGTFIAYFIPKNLEIIGRNDHQLDVFNCLYQERNPALTTRRFKALGFNSIVFDTNTATIERDENGSLHRKVNAFVEYVNNPASGLQVAISDTNAGIAYILIP